MAANATRNFLSALRSLPQLKEQPELDGVHAKPTMSSIDRLQTKQVQADRKLTVRLFVIAKLLGTIQMRSKCLRRLR